MSDKNIVISNAIVTDVMEEYTELDATSDKVVTQDKLSELFAFITSEIQIAVDLLE